MTVTHLTIEEPKKVVSPAKKTKKKPSESNKNIDVSDANKMAFQKKFKNYLNHKEEFEEKARRRR